MNLEQNTNISGIYYVCIWLSNVVSAIQHCELFGYRIGQEGKLSATAAQQLYEVNSALHSVRLHHSNADHRLIRLMIWQQPTNQGLGTS